MENLSMEHKAWLTAGMGWWGQQPGQGRTVLLRGIIPWEGEEEVKELRVAGRH